MKWIRNQFILYSFFPLIPDTVEISLSLYRRNAPGIVNNPNKFMVKVWFSILKGDWLKWVYAGPPLVNELFTYNNPNRKVANSILAGLLFSPFFTLSSEKK